MKYKAIIYDIDGTLVDTTSMNTIPLMKIAKEETGIDYSYDELKGYIAYAGKKTLELLGIQDIETVYARWVSYIRTSDIHAEPFDGIMEMLEGIQKLGIPQAIMSSKMYKQYELDIVNNQMGDFFCAKTLAEDTKEHKPTPAPMLHILKQLQLNPEDVLYVGDTHADQECCKRSGVDFAYASWGPLDLEEEPDYYLAKPTDLLDIVK